MATFENTVTIRRSVEDVFTFLADFENVPTWNHAIMETRKMSRGAVAIGTTYRQTRSLPTRTEETFTVTAHEPAKRLAVAGNIGPFRARISYELAPTVNGAELINTVDLKPSSHLLRLAVPIVVPKIKAAVAGNLDVLKSILEGRTGPAAPRDPDGAGRGSLRRGRPTSRRASAVDPTHHRDG